MNAVAQIIGFLGIPLFIIGIQMRQKKKLLILIIIANSLFVLSFIMLKAYPGALVCFIAIIETIFISYFESKEKNISNSMIIVLLFISIIGGLITYHRVPDVIPIIGVVLNTLLITNKKGETLGGFLQ